MKKTALILTTLFLANFAVADDAAKPEAFTLAAADLPKATSWVETKEDANLRLNQDLSEKTEAINAKITAKLEKQLEAKLASELSN